MHTEWLSRIRPFATAPRVSTVPSSAIQNAESELAASMFVGSGEMATRCRVLDWSATPLGPISSWSPSLRTTVGIVLESRNPMFLWWGPELVQLYNDAYSPSLGLGTRDPSPLGANGRGRRSAHLSPTGPSVARQSMVKSSAPS